MALMCQLRERLDSLEHVWTCLSLDHQRALRQSFLIIFIEVDVLGDGVNRRAERSLIIPHCVIS